MIVAWTWGGGFLSEFGYTDFAGGGIIHLMGGACGFYASKMIGPRLGKFEALQMKMEITDKMRASLSENPKETLKQL